MVSAQIPRGMPGLSGFNLCALKRIQETTGKVSRALVPAGRRLTIHALPAAMARHGSRVRLARRSVQGNDPADVISCVHLEINRRRRS
jgi:hypothetical protein